MVFKRQTIEPELFYGAKPEIFEKARALRKNMTKSEKLLWSTLRRNQFHGYYFRRQHPINQFIADFYCHEARLVIELDGSVHDQNEQINTDIHKVLSEIEKHLQRQKIPPL